MIGGLDFIGIPSQDSERSRSFYVDDVAAARAELEAKGVVFAGDTMDTGVCHMAFFTDPTATT